MTLRGLLANYTDTNGVHHSGINPSIPIVIIVVLAIVASYWWSNTAGQQAKRVKQRERHLDEQADAFHTPAAEHTKRQRELIEEIVGPHGYEQYVKTDSDPEIR